MYTQNIYTQQQQLVKREKGRCMGGCREERKGRDIVIKL